MILDVIVFDKGTVKIVKVINNGYLPLFFSQ